MIKEIKLVPVAAIKVDMLYKLLGRFKKNLRQQRVAALC